MANYILCRRAPSDKPFYIESVRLNVYTLEELCFFLSENLFLAGDVIADGLLGTWLKEECGLDEAGKEYAVLPDDKTAPRLCWIFAKSRYFTSGELRVLKSKAEAVDAMPLPERDKKKGDTLLKRGRYNRAIACYERSLAGKKDDAAYSAILYHNMAVACEKLFQSRRAYGYFVDAYELDKKPEYLKACLSAAYFDGGKEALHAGAEKLNAPESMVSEVLEMAEKILPYAMPSDVGAAVEKWIGEYHLSVD